MDSRTAGLPCPGCKARFSDMPDLEAHRKEAHGWPLDTQPDGQVADVVLTMGRYVLLVAGLAVAVEGDVCRDGKWHERTWTGQTLREAATVINTRV